VYGVLSLAHTLRIYVENRISYVAFQQAVREGLAIHAADRSFLKPVPLGVPSDVPSGGLPSIQCCQPVVCWGKGRCPLDPVCGGSPGVARLGGRTAKTDNK